MTYRIRRSMYRAIWEAQGKCCGVCGVPMAPVSFAHPIWGWTVEHVWPRARYRYDHQGNRLISHSVCNNRKGDRDPTGCELIILALANAVLGHELTMRPSNFSDGVTGPTALELAFQNARAA